MSQRLELSRAPKAFLQPGTASEYSIHGVGLGDPVEQLPALRALEPSLSEPVRQRLALGAAGEGLYAGSYGTEAHLEQARATGEGTLVLDADGGDALVVQVAGGQVSSLCWVGAAVRLLAPTRKAAATARGPTDDLERRDGLSIFTWTASQVALAWNDEAGEVTAITLGARPRRWSASDLVRAAVAWEHLGAGRRWPPVSPQPTSRALPVQAARLAALVRAFGLERWSGVELDATERFHFQTGAAARSSPLDRLHDGSVLLLRPVEEQARARRLLLEFDPKADLETPTRGERGVLALAWHRLRKLRQRIEATAQVNEDLLLGGGGVFFQAILVANHHAARARADADRLDRLLGALLDPARRELTWGALVRDHGWPDEDLEALRVADF